MTAFQHPRQLDNLRGNALNTNFRLGSGVVGRNRLKAARSRHSKPQGSGCVKVQLCVEFHTIYTEFCTDPGVESMWLY